MGKSINCIFRKKKTIDFAKDFGVKKVGFKQLFYCLKFLCHCGNNKNNKTIVTSNSFIQSSCCSGGMDECEELVVSSIRWNEEIENARSIQEKRDQ